MRRILISRPSWSQVKPLNSWWRRLRDPGEISEKEAWALGGFIGLALGITLMNQVVFRSREDYEPHKGDCF